MVVVAEEEAEEAEVTVDPTRRRPFHGSRTKASISWDLLPVVAQEEARRLDLYHPCRDPCRCPTVSCPHTVVPPEDITEAETLTEPELVDTIVVEALHPRNTRTEA